MDANTLDKVENEYSKLTNADILTQRIHLARKEQ